MVDLGPIHEQVKFNHADAQHFAKTCEVAAQSIDGQTGSRSSWEQTALEDFRGYFSEIFRSNAAVRARDASNLSASLNAVARAVRRVSEEARKEQQRRDTARQWASQHDDWWEKARDWFTGQGDTPPVKAGATPVVIDTPAPACGSRETPAPGSASGSHSGYTSARPSNLRTFASNSISADGSLRQQLASVSSAYSTSRGSCRWGGVNCDGVIGAFSRYLDANANDASWANTLANAFAAAGGEHVLSTLPDAAILEALSNAGVKVAREPLSIEDPKLYGVQTTTGYADDPVNTATGAFIEPETDMAYTGGCSSLRFERVYNSGDREIRSLGIGWSSVADEMLSFDTDGASWRRADGRIVAFPRQGNSWSRSIGDSYWLEADDDGWSIKDRHNAIRTFTRSGRLSGYGNDRWDWISCERGEHGRLCALVHARGARISLEWSDAGLISSASMESASSEYVYDTDGRLISVSLPTGARTYKYAGNGMIEAVTDADGVEVVHNTYQDDGRLLSQTSPSGRTSVYRYLPNGVTVVCDEDGKRSNTWISDAQGRCVGIIDSHGRRQSLSYDRWGNALQIIERDGSTTARSYDEHGRLVREHTPEGADLRWSYDSLGRLCTLSTSEDAVTLFDYASEGRQPIRITDPSGGVTSLTWHEGLMTGITDPTGVHIEFQHDDRGNLTAMTDGMNRTARWKYDSAGAITEAISPAGFTTRYRYDASGRLISRKDPDGAVWRFAYTLGGKIRSITRPDGSTDSVEYNERGEEQQHLDALGRSVESRFDDLGNLNAVILPDGSEWQYIHDSLSRLTTILDPDKHAWNYRYSATGDLTGIQDPSGVTVSAHINRKQREISMSDGLMSTTLSADPLGRIISERRGNDPASTIIYDRCGRAVEMLDPEGGRTLLHRDAAGRITELVTPTGLSTRYVYDATGHLSSVTEAGGDTTTFQYDEDGNLVRQILPSGDEASATYDACGRILTLKRPGDGMTRWTYDRCGRVTAMDDSWNGLRKFKYDAAGQITEITNALGGVTTLSYDALGRPVTVRDPLGGETSYEWNAQGRCVAATDPLLRTTTAGYDGAGRQIWQKDPDGKLSEFTYDRQGNLEKFTVNGHTVQRFARDAGGHGMAVANDATTEHLHWDNRGLLTRYERPEGAVEWHYDADGRRISMTGPDRRTTTYHYNAAGKVSQISHPTAGNASFRYDAAGRVSSVISGKILQTWQYSGVWPAMHSVAGTATRPSQTTIKRDDEDRILSITDENGTTSYGYDAAGQLVSATGPSGHRSWEYDLCGRIIKEQGPQGTTVCSYDAAGQLVKRETNAGIRRYSYDATGRRISEHGPGASARTYQWNDNGYLSSVSWTPAQGPTRTVNCMTSPLGYLLQLDDRAVWWDVASAAPAPIRFGGDDICSVAAACGIGGTWKPTGWRMLRQTLPSDPWGDGLSADESGIGPAGTLHFAGLEWLGNRVYDAPTRGFLSPDPVPAPYGVAWAANPYEYAGNNPLSILDPNGLKPVTDMAVLEQWSNSHTGFMQRAEDWTRNNWEYLAGGAMVIAGGAMMCTGVGGPAGMALLSAGADTIIQKATTGNVSWGEVALSGVLGGVGGAAGQWVSKMSVHGVKAAVTMASVNGGVSAGGAAAQYGFQVMTGQEQYNGRKLLGTVVGGGISGAIGGLSEPVGGTVAKEYLGKKATGLAAKAISTGETFTSGVTGNVADQIISDRHVDIAQAGIAGVRTVGVDKTAGRIYHKFQGTESIGTTTLKQTSYFGTRTVHGLLDLSKNNTQALWGSAMTGVFFDLLMPQ